MLRLPALTLATSLVFAGSAWADGVKIENAWARATAPGQPVAAAFMDLTADADMTLLRAASPVAQSVELHTMRMEDGVMVMRALPEIALPRGKTVSLKPGGLHIMLIGLKAPLKEGERAAITLTVKGRDGKEQRLETSAEVRRMGGMAAGHNHH